MVSWKHNSSTNNFPPWHLKSIIFFILVLFFIFLMVFIRLINKSCNYLMKAISKPWCVPFPGSHECLLLTFFGSFRTLKRISLLDSLMRTLLMSSGWDFEHSTKCTGVAMNCLDTKGEVAAQMRVGFPALRKEMSHNIRGWKKKWNKIRAAAIILRNHRFSRDESHVRIKVTLSWL